MSDKSFGDNTSRNVVKNPLLSSAVTGLSIEDLTHNAVLLPAAPTQTLITRQDTTTPQARTLAHSSHDPPNAPFGDTNSNLQTPNTQTDHFTNILDHKYHIQSIKTPNITSTTQSKASIKTDDEFDVNEYFARLYGTRYVSAPFSHKEDQNANLEATEENLEEINLNEPDNNQSEYQNSLTADIAQNFSQLPTVLPQVASAVFSSFSSMLYKSREHTPEERSGPDPAQRVEEPSVQLGVEDRREVAPPPRQPLTEPPIGGTSNYRITTKKKAYAQIPGLSSGMATPQSQNVPSYFIPAAETSTDNTIETGIDSLAHNETYNIYSPGDDQPNMFAVVKDKEKISSAIPHVSHVQDSSAFVSSQPTAAIIPPPPMFSNKPRKDQTGSVEKTILPPSVARRISAKSHAAPTSFPSNIFVPSMPNSVTQMFEPTSGIEIQSQSLPTANIAPTFGSQSSMFVPTNEEPSVFTPFGGHISDSSIPPKFSTITPMAQTPASIAPIGPPPSNMRTSNIGQISKAPGTSIYVPTSEHTVADVDQPYLPAKVITKPPSAIAPPNPSELAAKSVPIFNPISLHGGVASEKEFESLRNEATSSQTIIPLISTNIPPPAASIANVGQVLFPTNTSALPSPNFFKSSQLTSEISANDPFLMQQSAPPMLDISKIAEPIIEPPKPVGEPPKISGGLNYRMTKKRPQYYAGPIEGVGSISNNVKPIMPPINTQLPGSSFTPHEQALHHTPSISAIEPVITPFDICKPIDQVAAPSYNIQAPEYSTAFDLSRPTTERFEQPKPEPKGFDIFGSLKSKLSSIDVNKIQSKVTTFFDPSFNDSKKNVSGDYDTVSYHPVNTSSYAQGQSSFEIFMPSVEIAPQAGQSYNYQPQSEYNYGEKSKLFNTQPYNYYQDKSQIPHGNYGSYPHVGSEAYDVSTTSHPLATMGSGAESQAVQGGEKSFSDISGKIEMGSKSEAATFPTNILVSKSGVSAFEVGSEGFMAPSGQLYDDVDMTTLDKIVKDVADFCIGSGKENIDDFPQNTDKISEADVDCKISTSKSSIGFNVAQTEHISNPIGNIGERKLDFSAKQFFDNPTTNLFSDELKTEDYEKSIYKPNLRDIASTFGKNDELKSSGESNDPVFELKDMDSAFLPEISAFPSDLKPISLNPPAVLKSEVFTDFKFKDGFKIKDGVTIKETNLLESLSTDVIPIVAVSSIPLFGLSTIIADSSTEMADQREIINVPLFEPQDTLFHQNANVSFFENVLTTSSANKEGEQVSEQNIRDTCKEVDKDEENETNWTTQLIENITYPEEDEEQERNWTTQLIENITSPIQLSNSVEVALTETNPGIDRDENAFETTQCAEISQISEQTINTINVQSATAIMENDSDISNPRTFGWPKAENAYAASEHDYTYQLQSNSLGLFGTNPLFFEDASDNASAELKTEHKASQEKLLASQNVTVASGKAAREDPNTDETGLDVLSIEQDAKEDFPIFEEFVIEPSETDDKIDYKERERTSESSMPDTFTNRIERFKKMEEVTGDPTEETYKNPKGFKFNMPPKYNPTISIASYFDTGNYAVETHYRNSISSPSCLTGYSVGSPNMPMRIPPGFEEEFHRRISGICCQETTKSFPEIADITQIPETSTQTRNTATHTFTSPTLTTEVSKDISGCQESKGNDVYETHKLPVFANMFGGAKSTDDAKEHDSVNTEASKPKADPPPTQSLPDPLNFFASDEPIATPDSSNRLASYFSMPPPKPDHSKPFFELSQSQNHYRHESPHSNVFNIPHDKYIDNLKLMNDLTSLDNFEVNKDQVVKTVNYFTVKYDITTELNMGEPIDVKAGVNPPVSQIDVDDDVIEHTINKCIHCCNMLQTRRVSFGNYKVKKANDTTDTSSKQTNMEQSKDDSKRTVTVNFDNFTVDGENSDGVAVINENRQIGEYVPVKHHWFYRVDVEDKSIWRGFSVVDSSALEEAFLSPQLTDDTVVATDGGRYDVNVIGRVRIPVYWCDKPTNVRRCSWFYKGTTDARFVPYREDVANLLEDEYRHGLTTGEWHRRLVLPDHELVIMHGPSVMVHFLHAGNTDAFSGPSQSSSRPRVVRRGCDESEIEEPYPSSIDHLLLLCHGVGSACDMRFRSVEEVVEDFRTTSLQLLQSHYRNSYDTGAVGRVEVLPISWHATLHSGETGVDRRLAQLTLDSIPRLRSFTNDTVLDVLFYTSPVFCQTIIETVCNEINRIYNLFKKRNPNFTGGVSLGGHSLGSVILYDLLCHQTPEKPSTSTDSSKKFVAGSAGTGQPCVHYPKLEFSPDALYALGSPIAIFECIRGVESLGKQFALPTCKNFFNIFHPYDPIAYRIEPLINPQLRDVKPYLIPHHKGRKRMHLELKDTMARVGADLKQKLIESLKVTWNKWKSQPQTPPPDGQLEKVVEEELEKESLCDEVKEELGQNDTATPDMLGNLNAGRRIDYVLQEAPLEMINEYLFAMSSHVGYWESEDTMLLMLREIYDALGVQPDSTVPQQSLTVQRTRPAKDDRIYMPVPGTDNPSTSQGGT